MKPYDVVAALEERVAEYGGSKYAVAVDSCTNAILLALIYERMTSGYKVVELPKYTYVGVAYAVRNAGLGIKFTDSMWQGAYKIGGTLVIDSARRFHRGMYEPGSLYCLSAHWGKHLKIGRGGFILTDNENVANTLRLMRFDGRTAGVPPRQDNFTVPGYHCYMLPEEAARGLMLMNYMPDDNPDIPWDDYADLSQFDVFKGY
jgi:dTDP-4-amino-4,6-dideoxygalactose transaminase